jgi:predicted DNA binding CopG/RHH family protein
MGKLLSGLSAPVICTKERLNIMKNRANKAMPSLKNDVAAEQFVESADLSEFDLSGFTPIEFEFEPKTAVLNMRLPQKLLNLVKIKAKAEGIPYTRYIRLILEQNIKNTSIG